MADSKHDLRCLSTIEGETTGKALWKLWKVWRFKVTAHNRFAAAPSHPHAWPNPPRTHSSTCVAHLKGSTWFNMVQHGSTWFNYKNKKAREGQQSNVCNTCAQPSRDSKTSAMGVPASAVDNKASTKRSIGDPDRP